MARCVKEEFHPAAIMHFPPKTIEVVLRLSEEEAGTLKQLLSQIGGDPEGPRGKVDIINQALRLAGVDSTEYKVEIYYGGERGVPYLRIEKGD